MLLVLYYSCNAYHYTLPLSEATSGLAFELCDLNYAMSEGHKNLEPRQLEEGGIYI